jgi:hypothetical protein
VGPAGGVECFDNLPKRIALAALRGLQDALGVDWVVSLPPSADVLHGLQAGLLDVRHRVLAQDDPAALR